LDFGKKIVLVTFHRRESFGKSLLDICSAIRKIAETNKEIQIVFPVHPNPNVKIPVFDNLSNISNIFLIEPLEYPKLIWIMNKSYFIITDSGGIQEEAPTLGKPVLVLRNVTERQEGVDSGVAQLVGTNPDLIINAANLLLNDVKHYDKIANTINPYGTGNSCHLIYDIVVDFFEHEKE
jgi:UDP-N-acetylglucosamine 2-epimerase (non-hydrolysing)